MLRGLLVAEGYKIGRRHVKTLMKRMGIVALGPKPRTSKPAPGHKIFPYLLRGLAIDRPNQVWCADITYIPIGRGFFYLVAIMDWASRAVLAWRLSNRMDTSFCVAALAEALVRFGRPDIFNTDQGSQFTSQAFTGTLTAAGIRISMDGRGRRMDNVFIERLWRSLKHEDIFLKHGRSRSARWHRGMAPASGAGQPDADSDVARWHDWHARRTGCGHDGQRKRAAHMSTAAAAAPSIHNGRMTESKTETAENSNQENRSSGPNGGVHFSLPSTASSLSLLPAIRWPSSGLRPSFVRLVTASLAPHWVGPGRFDCARPRSGSGYRVPIHHHLLGPIRPPRRHIVISPHSGLYAMPSLCGSALASRERFRAFTARSFLACRLLGPRGVRSSSVPDQRCRRGLRRE
jgi:transposase InsO family protein